MKQLIIAALIVLIGSAAYAGGFMLLHVGDANGNGGGGGVSGALLLEDGSSFLLLEDGASQLCLEGGC